MGVKFLWFLEFFWNTSKKRAAKFSPLSVSPWIGPILVLNDRAQLVEHPRLSAKVDWLPVPEISGSKVPPNQCICRQIWWLHCTKLQMHWFSGTFDPDISGTGSQSYIALCLGCSTSRTLSFLTKISQIRWDTESGLNANACLAALFAVWFYLFC